MIEQIQIICTPEGLQEYINEAVQKAFDNLTTPKEGPNQSDYSLESPISVKELCGFLGVTEPTIIRWRKKGKIPFMQIGSRILFQKSEVLKALENKGNDKIKFMSRLRSRGSLADQLKTDEVKKELKRLNLPLTDENIILMENKLELIRTKRFEQTLKSYKK